MISHWGFFFMIVGAIGIVLWHRSTNKMIQVIREKEPQYFREWVALNQGVPKPHQVIRLIKRHHGYLGVILVLVFLLLSHAFTVLGVVLLIVG